MSKKPPATYVQDGYLMEARCLPAEAPSHIESLSPLLKDRELHIAALRNGIPLTMQDREYIADLLEGGQKGRPRSSVRYEDNKKLRAILVKKLVRDEVARLKTALPKQRGGWRPTAIENVAARFKISADAVENIISGK
ncbi:hypothetical protein [Mesorhizobium sp. M0800]|uniref:hypothetical protein n=1 Tax=Mesorhizobium sp. M0800 TaxID=2957000 RepID=UPI00333C0FF7